VGKMNWEIRTDICTLPYVRQLSSGKLLCSTGNSIQGSVVTREKVQETEDICLHRADLLHCTAEANTTL